jgi:energy-coupling factor transporter ATP-binding protein EcfA2
MTAVASIDLSSPFPGLRPFREEEEYLFFGRDSQVDMMVDKLAAKRFLAVVGTSGSGKSSLVNCGLRPALRRGVMASAGSAWRMAQFRPGGDPIKALARALAQPGVLFTGLDFGGEALEGMIEATLEMSKLGVVDLFEQAQPSGQDNLLLIVDQFEELFRYKTTQPSAFSSEPHRTEEASIAFVNLLLEAARSEYSIYVVLTMRSDFLGDCARFSGLPEAVNEGQYLVPRLTREERRAAITGPIAVGGGEISPILLTRLVNDVGDNPDQLSILQHALNRTWAQWRRDRKDNEPISLSHYQAIGTMAHALDQHAEKAFAELTTERQKRICEIAFQALTDKGSDARGVRRPTDFATLCAIANASPDEVAAVLGVFRKPSRSFLMPPALETLEPGTIIDISHESLMRVWTRLKDWVEREAESAGQFRRLAQNAALHTRGAAGLMTDPELSLMLEWQRTWQPNAAWARRYHAGFEQAIFFLEQSCNARDAVLLLEKEEARRALQRARRVAAVLGLAFVIALGLAIYAFVERSTAIVEHKARAESEALNEAQQKLIETEKRAKAESDALNAKLSESLKQTNDAKKQAEESNQRAIKEAERATRNAQLFVSAMQAQAAVQRAANVQLEKAATLQRDTDAKKDAATLDRDKKDLEAAKSSWQELSGDAARKAEQAFAIMGAVRIIGTNKISRSDVFDVNSGSQVIGSSPARNPTDMFNGAQGSAERATVFADGQPVDSTHWIEWHTKADVTVKSVSIFAAHDPVRSRRAFSHFKLLAKKQNKWVEIAQYSPSLPYGGSCSSDPCLPPAVKFRPGTVLAACINVGTPVAASEYRAEFVQAVSALEGFSGPRVLQLDGYRKPDCSN